MTSPRHLTKDKGDLALSKVIANLRQHGIMACLPLSEHLPFDLIAVMPDMTTLIRVQVKYRSGTKNGIVKVQFRNNYYDSQKIYSKPVNFSEIDAYAVYIPDTDCVCYFRVANLPTNARTLSLRFEPPKNNQRKGVHLIKDFLDPFSLVDATHSDYINSVTNNTHEDEIAIAKFAVYLQENNDYPLYPNSRFVPFDLLGVSADTNTMTRYVIRSQKVNYTPCSDIFVIYEQNQEQPKMISANSLKQDFSVKQNS